MPMQGSTKLFEMFIGTEDYDFSVTLTEVLVS